MNSIHNFSEIAPLKTVLMHRPGKEFANLTPNTLQRLLFDDIPDLPLAEKEHDAFAKAFRDEGVKVVYLTDLTAQALDTGPEVREQFLRQFIREGGCPASLEEKVYAYLNRLEDNRELISQCIAGIDSSELELDFHAFYTCQDAGKMILDPLPNVYAPRDPWATIGNTVSLHRMTSVTRCRETIFGEYIFRYHPEYKGTKLVYDRYAAHHIEGGDIQVLNAETVAVGISERTEPDAIADLARNLFRDPVSSFRRVIAVLIPKSRSFMHLDTVMTQVDTDKFVVHSEVMSVASFYEITPGKEDLCIREIHDSLDKVLEKYLGLEKVHLILCGNGNRIAAEREQWSDGANTICIRPGTVIAYDRNHITNDALRKAGIKVIEIPSCELSRGRGGPHCLTMALVRE